MTQSSVADLDQQNERLASVAARIGQRLRGFIASRVSDTSDAEDIFQDVFYELLEAVRLMQPIEEMGAWLFRVARNRIIDRFRRKATHASVPMEESSVDNLLPSAEAGPDAAYARTVLMEQLKLALEELPHEQRDVFVAHEIDGRSFKEIAGQTGVPLNTLLARKHYAVRFLRKRLAEIYEEVGLDPERRH